MAYLQTVEGSSAACLLLFPVMTMQHAVIESCIANFRICARAQPRRGSSLTVAITGECAASKAKKVAEIEEPVCGVEFMRALDRKQRRV